MSTRSVVVEVRAPVTASRQGLARVEVASDEPLRDGGTWVGAQLVRQLTDGPGVEPLRAEVLEVEGTRGRLYVEVEPQADIAAGPARLYPFDFLAAPYRLVTSSACLALRPRLVQRLAAARGELHAGTVGRGEGAWGHGWGIVWGPPGTGKTWTLGQRVAGLLEDPSERVLVVSTTHKAADQAALELGRAARERGVPIGSLLRVSHTLADAELRAEGLAEMLPVQDPRLAEQLAAHRDVLRDVRDPWRRAAARRGARHLRSLVPGLRQLVWEPSRRALVTTVHAGLGLVVSDEVHDALAEGHMPFTTVVVDEAGLVSRAAAAALSLLASRRTVLVGDPRQLSPIARAARSRSRAVVRWVARSALSHLDNHDEVAHVDRLHTQRRMHPDIRAGVDALQYGGRLRDDEAVTTRPWPDAGRLAGLPRLLWIPVDRVAGVSLREAASQRGPGGSRIREGTRRVLDRLVEVLPELARQEVLAISPYRAQAAALDRWIARRELRWTASTVHAQQGAQADVVLFDTVHASSTNWQADEWCRLVNVGLSRARHLAVLLATEAEVMGQPWMRPLRPHLVAMVPGRGGLRSVEVRGVQGDLFGAQRGTDRMGDAPPSKGPTATGTVPATRASSAGGKGIGEGLGAQIAERRRLRSVLSREQQVLVDRELSDAGPRLVRGVAGSGKTLVLARWAARALHGMGVPEVAIVYANAALGPLLRRMVDEAWVEIAGGAVPWDRVHFLHIAELLTDLRRALELPAPCERWNYDAQAAEVLSAVPEPEPRFDAVLVDEAQDLGHHALRLLVQLARPRGDHRPVMIFYDNAQNIYGRSTPRWRELGLDMRGRSDVMRESFRTTRPILELALNVCHALRPLGQDPDMRELMRERLLTEVRHGDRVWWQAHYAPVDGQAPVVSLYDTRQEELDAVLEQVRRWVRDEGVRPDDIGVVVLRKEDGQALAGDLCEAGIPACYASSGALGHALAAPDARVHVSTAHSYKGYDVEVLLVVGATRFHSGDRVFVETLYVALTRARTVLHVTGTHDGHPALVEAWRTVSAEPPAR